MVSKVIILQPYRAPYRIDLFNAIASDLSVNLTVVYYDKPEKRRKWLIDKTINFNEITIRPLVLYSGFEHNISIPNFIKLFTLIQTGRPEFVIGFPNTVGIFMMIISYFYDFKLIGWSEATEITEKNRDRFKRKLRRRFFSKAAVVFVPGIQAKDYIEKSLNIKNKSLYIMKNSVDNSFTISKNDFEAKFSDFKVLKIGFSGNLNMTKGIDLLLTAVRNLNKYNNIRNYKLFLLGSGPIPIPQIPNLIHLGFLNGEEYVNQLHKMHVFILPSRRDCNPLTVIEALKSGCLCLLSDAVGNFPETLIGNGFVFKRDNSEEIERALLKVLSMDTNEIKLMASRSLELGRHFTHLLSANAFLNGVNGGDRAYQWVES